MPHLTRYIFLILVLLGACVFSIFPVEKNLRLGKDLAGGVSLIYTVELEETDNPEETISRMIEVLKERVDPNGLYEISFVRQGRERIMVTMPLPNQRVQQLRDEYESQLARLEAYAIEIDEFERAMRLSGEERDEALRAMMDSEPRQVLLGPVLALAETAAEARRAYEAAQDNDQTTPEELEAIAGEAAEADIALDEARRRVIASIVTPDDVRTALELSREGPRILDNETGEMQRMESPRDRALGAIRTRLQELPGAEQVLADIIAAHESYTAQRRGYDDPNDLKRLLQGAGVLAFRIAVQPDGLPRAEIDAARQELIERGPQATSSTEYRWYPINKLEDWYDDTAKFRAIQNDYQSYFASNYNIVVQERDGQYYVLLYDTRGKRLTKAEQDWALTGAFRATDDFGKPAIGFRMNAVGANLLGQLTENHLQQPMAILLDGRVYTSPNINGRITSNGIIQGSFSDRELDYIIKTLSAGSLQARLSVEPISQNTLAPSLGADNLRKGLTAGWIALVIVAVFMVIYYFSNGFIAVIALACNAIIILGAMSLNRAAFTLPGIAGIVLTFGMAVDANVLIYERIREEVLAGNDFRTSVRVAYQKVLSTIVDANITNLIICFVLGYTATQEVKGFAITLGIGVVATMFSSLLITRVVYSIFIDHLKVKNMSQLPMAVPFIQRLLSPNIDWIKLRPLFLVVSIVFVGAGLEAIFIQRGELLDLEFRGGTEVTLQLKTDTKEDGATETLTMTRQEVEQRVLSIVEEAQQRLAENPGDQEAVELAQLQLADVVAVNALADGVTSSQFQIRSVIQDSSLMQRAIINEFYDVIESQPALSFRDSEVTDAEEAPVFQIIARPTTLGNVIGRDGFQNDLSEYYGGAAIVLDNLEPAPTRDQLERRISYMRRQGDVAGTALKRDWDLIVVGGTNDAVQEAVLLVQDPAISPYDEQLWKTQVAQLEWDLVRSALTSTTTLAGVQSFSAEIAKSFRAQAVVAVLLSFLLILIYIWVRFGSVRYSLAAIAALMHDVVTTIGLIAFAEILYKYIPSVAAVGVEPFKINLGIVAAILTIIGYSLNDTIVILDRIRENRGKLAYASRKVVNESINQTVSRTIITSGTTFLALVVMFVFGGSGLAAFTYALMCGVIVGTYSSVAVAAPLVFSRKIPPSAQPFHRRSEEQSRTEKAALPDDGAIAPV